MKNAVLIGFVVGAAVLSGVVLWSRFGAARQSSSDSEVVASPDARLDEEALALTAVGDSNARHAGDVKTKKSDKTIAADQVAPNSPLDVDREHKNFHDPAYYVSSSEFNPEQKSVSPEDQERLDELIQGWAMARRVVQDQIGERVDHLSREALAAGTFHSFADEPDTAGDEPNLLHTVILRTRETPRAVRVKIYQGQDLMIDELRDQKYQTVADGHTEIRKFFRDL